MSDQGLGIRSVCRDSNKVGVEAASDFDKASERYLKGQLDAYQEAIDLVWDKRLDSAFNKHPKKVKDLISCLILDLMVKMYTESGNYHRQKDD